MSKKEVAKIVYMRDPKNDNSIIIPRIPEKAVVDSEGVDLETKMERLDPTMSVWQSGDGNNSVVIVGSEGTAQGNYSTVEGKGSITGGNYTDNTLPGDTADTSKGSYSHAEGRYTIACGSAGSHSEGNKTLASGQASHAEGNLSKSSNTASHAEGTRTVASGSASHSEGADTIASGNYSHSENRRSMSVGDMSHAEGFGISIGQVSHAETANLWGNITLTGDANATQYTCVCSTDNIVSLYKTLDASIFNDILLYGRVTNSNLSSYARITNLYNLSLSGNDLTIVFSVDKTLSSTALVEATGYRINITAAIGNNSHSEGGISIGKGSHAEGGASLSLGQHAHSEGDCTIALNDCEHSEGRYNVSTKASNTYGNAGNTQHSIGIGSYEERKNAVEVMQNGDVYMLGLGGYNGKNSSSASSMQSVISDIQSTEIENVTYSDLKLARNNGLLVPGKQYRITDYVATVNHSECRSANHPFDLIVTALSSNEISEQCRAIQHQGDTYFNNSNLSAWKVEYCLDNDTIRFDWADSTNGKGVIYHLVDEWNNDVPYDFKGIQFKRYKVSVASGYNDYLGTLAGQYVGIATDPSGRSVQGLVNNTSDYKWYYTFSWINDNVLEDYSIKDFNGCVENTIDMYFHGESNFVTSRSINNTVFAAGEDIRDILEVVLGAAYEPEEGFDSIASNKIGQISGYNTVFGSFNRVYTNAQFRGCVIVGEFYENTIGSYFQDNKILSPISRYCTYANSFCHNIINSEEISSNTIDEHCDNNKIKCKFFDRNILGSRFESNVVLSSEYFTDNEFHSNMHDNVFNHAVSHTNFLGGQVTDCVFNNIILNSTFSGMCQYLTIDSGTPADRLMTTDVKYVSGTQGNRITLSDSRLFRTSVNSRHIIIERDSDGDIIATWKDNGQEVGIMYDQTQNDWVSIADETVLNKVTTISASSTDTEYPSAKAVYDFVMSMLNNS